MSESRIKQIKRLRGKLVGGITIIILLFVMKKGAFVCVFLISLFSCSTNVNQSEVEQRKDKMIFNYSIISNMELKKNCDTIFNYLDKNPKVIQIHEERNKLLLLIDSIRIDIIDVTGGIKSNGTYSGNTAFEVINNYMLGKDGFEPKGECLFQNLSTYYNLFDTKYYRIPYLNWDSKLNYVYKYDKSESYKNFVELNLTDNTLLQVMITLEIIKKDVLNYELLELYNIKKI